MKPCYPVLESIKDGTAINGKYQSEVLRFKTPNIVIVFSNDDPDVISPKREINVMTDDCLRGKKCKFIFC